MRLDGKVALITGGATGIGAAIAAAFVAEGARVCITGRRRAVLEHYAASFPRDRLIVCVADVCKVEDVKRMVDTTVAFGGRLDIVVNNAGMTCSGNVVDLDLAVWQKMLDTNLTGPFLVSKYAIPHLIGGGGSIINVASIAGVLGLPEMAAYCATKAGLLGLTRQVAFDYGAQKVRCNVVLPGAFLTEMLKRGVNDFAESLGVDFEGLLQTLAFPAPLKRIAKPEEIKGLFVYLASDESSYTTAAEFVCDGGAHTVDASAIMLNNLIANLHAANPVAADR